MPKMNVIKSIYVDAAPEKIYPIINDLSNWEQWSPWVIAEPNALLKTAVYSPPKLRTLRGRYQGYPFRTVIRGNTLEGYSDHFPVYTILGEKKD
jgi:hypothetical protein